MLQLEPMYMAYIIKVCSPELLEIQVRDAGSYSSIVSVNCMLYKFQSSHLQRCIIIKKFMPYLGVMHITP